MGAIYRREMGSFFTSGLGYVFLTVFYAFSGYFFYTKVIESGISDTSPMFASMFIMFIFLIPVLTMRLLSEEKKNRTDQGLLTAPVNLWEIVMGKYLAAFTLFLIAECIVFVYALLLRYLGSVVWTSLIGNFAAMLFLGAAFIAIGLFVSSLTENQMSAAVVSFVVMIVFYLFDETLLLRVSNDRIREILSALSFRTRYYEFTKGVFSLSSIIFFLSTAFLFNFFTVKVLEKRRWS